MPQEAYERSPIVALYNALDGGIQPGQVGLIVARAGVGKSALLVHIALDALLRDDNVLHVSLRDTVEHVRAHYDELFRTAAHKSPMRDRTSAMVAAERHRMIHSYLDRAFDVDHLTSNLRMLQEVAGFEPVIAVVDGLEEDVADEVVPAVAALAKEFGMRVWVSVHSRVVTPALAEAAAVVVKLVPEGRSIRITRVDGGDESKLPLELDPTTMLVSGEGEDKPRSRPWAPRPADCTLYSGGANGSEAAFGAAAERFGVHEVNFTFDGHKQARERGRYELSPRELQAGDVSLVYVSRRLNRTYSEGSLIKRVLQTLWHMVSRSQQVFVVGQIQEDGTVVGGTGWSVELARMWNKNLWVYDQNQKGWFQWDGDAWTAGTPVIESVHFTGTGTRYLTDEGKAAISDLFARSYE